MASVSPLGPSVAVEGLLLQIDNGTSPDAMQTIANVTDVSLPVVADVVDVTNVGDSWHRRFPTLHDMGKIAFKIYWVMEEVTHRNSANGGSVGAGLRYCLINNLLRNFQLVYNDGNESTDAFPAYVTSFAITGGVGKVFIASVELSNSGAPSLV